MAVFLKQHISTYIFHVAIAQVLISSGRCPYAYQMIFEVPSDPSSILRLLHFPLHLYLKDKTNKKQQEKTLT